MISARGYAAQSATTPLGPFAFEHRELGPKDVRIAIAFCGVCHSDLHQARNEWGGSSYPMVPGHEIVGAVTAVGSDVARHAVGDRVAVGCMVDSCRQCAACAAGDEQYCDRAVFTYNSRHYSGLPTWGGYADVIVVDEAFVVRVPNAPDGTPLDLARVAPLLCAGVTTWSPLRHWKVGPGQRVGVVGLGGLGHMGVKLARSLGAHVTLFTTSPGKVEDALRLGAHEAVVTKDAAAFKPLRGTLDFILDTVSAEHDLGAYLGALRPGGTMCLVGLPEKPTMLSAGPLVSRRRALAGSMIGGIPETQEMLDYCAAHAILADVERIGIADINVAYQRMLKNDVKYRFVIDLATL